MNLQVCPNLDKIVQAAQEANISIADMQFVRNPRKDDALQAIALRIEGSSEAKSYFSWLLAKANLNAELVS